MSAIRKHPIQLTLLVLLVIVCGLALALRFNVKAQEGSGPAWADADVGAVATPGSAQGDGNGGYALTSGQSDIGGTADTFNYLYQSLGTNGQIVALVGAMQGGGSWAKAGVMIRETLDPGAREAIVDVTPGNGVYFQWRPTADGKALRSPGSSNAAPCWVKLVRSCDWVGGYESEDGTNWSLVDWQVISNLADQVYVGMAVCSGGTQAAAASALFDQVNVSLADPLAILNPVIGTGNGLMGSYYPNRHLFGKVAMTRLDGPIEFDWSGLDRLKRLYDAGQTNWAAVASAGKTAIGMPRIDQFSVRWMGEVQAQFTEPYTIYVNSDDGIRVWLNEQLIIDDWTCHAATEKTAIANLTAGQRYLLRVEYFHNHGNARVKLSWSSPSTRKQVIPQSQLYSQPTMDSNGLPIYWEEHYFGQTNVDPNADPDNDGQSNLKEYQQHTDPTSPLKWGLPNEWTHGDIEGFGGNSHGETYYSNGVFTVTSSGHDIWTHHDDFHYAFQAIGTNGEIVARILGIAGEGAYAKAGVMLRENLDDNARDVMLMITWTNGLFAEGRLWPDDVTRETRGLVGQNFPLWLKIARSGDWVGSYASTDGTNWTLVDWQTLSKLSDQVFVGMAVTTRNPSANRSPCTAQFDNVSVGSAPAADIMNMVTGTGNGLEGGYQNSSLLYLPALTNRVDLQLQFDWSHNPPMSLLNPDSYGVCWQGEVQAQLSEPYTFSIQTRREDWVRVWVNEKLVINQWRTLHTDGDFKGTTVNLVAGQHYLIRVEMYNNNGHGRAILNWSSPSTPERVIPEDQLYSQPQMDPDGSGLPVIWEQIYFGHTGVDPNDDPDHDGLSNLQEWQYHTDPTNSDTDGDGLPDAWEIGHGLDPQYPDADLDYDNSGLSNLQDYELGLNPLNVDVNDDGLPDWFEEEYLGTGPSLVCTNQISVALSVNGALATNYLGNWQVDGTDIYCLDRRGGVDFNLPVAKADKYVLNLIGTQNQNNSFETSFSLLLGIDSQTMEHYTLNAGYGTNGAVELVLPYLQAGPHVFHVFWDGYASYSSLRIKQVKLLAVSGATNHAGIKEWAAQMIADQSGMDNTNPIVASYSSPVCLEGRDPFPMMMTMTNGQANVLSPVATSDGHWYVNMPLSANAKTVFRAAFQNGALTQNQNVEWVPVNLLSVTNLTIRKGDSLLFNAMPGGGTPGQVQVQIGSSILTGTTASPVAYQFKTPGEYAVSGTYTSASAQSQSGSITVDVVEQKLPRVEPCAWVGMERMVVLTNLAPEAVLQADSRLTCYVSGTNANGGVQLTLGIDANEPRTILARLGSNGPVLDSTQVQGFDVWSGDQAYTKVIQVFPDGSQLVEMLVISSPVETNVVFVLQPIVSGVMFDDGTTLKTLASTNFDALDQCPVRFIRPASATTSVCNSIQVFQGKRQIGYRK
jgi:PA14 domain/Bacterial TSP3 repeat